MNRRIDVDAGLQPAAIPGRILHELYKHAREALPEECCGLILGDAQERFAELVRCGNQMTRMNEKDPVTYPRDNHSAYWMSPTDYQRACEQAEARGQRVTAVYHSHVGADAYLSEEDLLYAENAHFPFPEAAQIVVAVAHADGQPRAALFEPRGAGARFVGRAVEARGE